MAEQPTVRIQADLTVCLPQVGQAFVVQRPDGCKVVMCCWQGKRFPQPEFWPGRQADEQLRPEVERALRTAKQKGEI